MGGPIMTAAREARQHGVFPRRRDGLDRSRDEAEPWPCCKESACSCPLSSREMLARLVAFPSVSTSSNLDIIDFCRDWLASHGVESHLVPSPRGDKANLYATIGPTVEGGVVLSGHTDVVPVEGQAWTSDPLTLTERDGTPLRARHDRHEGLRRPRPGARARDGRRRR